MFKLIKLNRSKQFKTKFISRLKTSVFLGFHFLLITTLLIGQEVDRKLENSLFWKIEGNGLKKASYLFGTIHLIPSSEYFLPEGVENALRKADKIFMEIDVNQMGDMGVMMQLMDKIIMVNDTSLSDLINDEEYKQLKTHFDKIGLPLSLFDKVKPMFLSAMVGAESNPFALQDGSSKSYELEFAEFAKTNNKEVAGLESLEFQISLFDSIPYRIQAKMLLDAVLANKEDSEQMNKLYMDYKHQDLTALNQSISNEDQQMAPYLEMMVYNRNKNWIPIMKKEMEKVVCFFAVGAGHLGGEQGVIRLLKKEGYKVTAVKKGKI